MSESYIIKGGHEGADRLKVLARATWAASEAFLRSAGLGAGGLCLDAGCGGGEIARRVAEAFGVAVLGVDADEDVVRLAQAAADGAPRLRFVRANVEKEDLLGLGPFDFVYARFLLSHLRGPGEVVRRLAGALKPGGALVVEDVDFRGHFCHPENAAFDRYVELYQDAARRRGVDPLIGPKLPALLESCGLKDVRLNVVLPTFRGGEGKLMALLTMRAIRDSVVAAGAAGAGEVEEVIRGLELFSADPGSIMSLPRIFQVWGVRPQ